MHGLSSWIVNAIVTGDRTTGRSIQIISNVSRMDDGGEVKEVTDSEVYIKAVFTPPAMRDFSKLQDVSLCGNPPTSVGAIITLNEYDLIVFRPSCSMPTPVACDVTLSINSLTNIAFLPGMVLQSSPIIYCADERVKHYLQTCMLQEPGSQVSSLASPSVSLSQLLDEMTHDSSDHLPAPIVATSPALNNQPNMGTDLRRIPRLSFTFDVADFVINRNDSLKLAQEWVGDLDPIVSSVESDRSDVHPDEPTLRERRKVRGLDADGTRGRAVCHAEVQVGDSLLCKPESSTVSGRVVSPTHTTRQPAGRTGYICESQGFDTANISRDPETFSSFNHFAAVTQSPVNRAATVQSTQLTARADRCPPHLPLSPIHGDSRTEFQPRRSDEDSCMNNFTDIRVDNDTEGILQTQPEAGGVNSNEATEDDNLLKFNLTDVSAVVSEVVHMSADYSDRMTSPGIPSGVRTSKNGDDKCGAELGVSDCHVDGLSSERASTSVGVSDEGVGEELSAHSANVNNQVLSCGNISLAEDGGGTALEGVAREMSGSRGQENYGKERKDKLANFHQKCLHTEEAAASDRHGRTRGGKSPVHDVSGKSPVHDVSGKSPVHDVSGKSPVHDVSGKSPGHDVSGKSPIHDVSGKSPIHDVSGKSPVHDVSGKPTVHDVSGKCPIHDGSGKSPIHDGSGKSPVHDVSGKSPGHDVSGKSPIHDVSGKPPVHDVSGKSPVHDVSGKSPVHDVSGKSPVHDVSGKSPVHDVSGKFPVHDVSGISPVYDVSGKSPIDDVSGKSSVHDVSGNSPIHDVSGKSPIHDVSGEESVESLGTVTRQTGGIGAKATGGEELSNLSDEHVVFEANETVLDTNSDEPVAKGVVCSHEKQEKRARKRKRILYNPNGAVFDADVEIHNRPIKKRKTRESCTSEKTTASVSNESRSTDSSKMIAAYKNILKSPGSGCTRVADNEIVAEKDGEGVRRAGQTGSRKRGILHGSVSEAQSSRNLNRKDGCGVGKMQNYGVEFRRGMEGLDFSSDHGVVASVKDRQLRNFTQGSVRADWSGFSGEQRRDDRDKSPNSESSAKRSSEMFIKFRGKQVCVNDVSRLLGNRDLAIRLTRCDDVSEICSGRSVLIRSPCCLGNGSHSPNVEIVRYLVRDETSRSAALFSHAASGFASKESVLNEDIGNAVSSRMLRSSQKRDLLSLGDCLRGHYEVLIEKVKQRSQRNGGTSNVPAVSPCKGSSFRDRYPIHRDIHDVSQGSDALLRDKAIGRNRLKLVKGKKQTVESSPAVDSGSGHNQVCLGIEEVVDCENDGQGSVSHESCPEKDACSGIASEAVSNRLPIADTPPRETGQFVQKSLDRCVDNGCRRGICSGENRRLTKQGTNVSEKSRRELKSNGNNQVVNSGNAIGRRLTHRGVDLLRCDKGRENMKEPETMRQSDDGKSAVILSTKGADDKVSKVSNKAAETSDKRMISDLRLLDGSLADVTSYNHRLVDYSLSENSRTPQEIVLSSGSVKESPIFHKDTSEVALSSDTSRRLITPVNSLPSHQPARPEQRCCLKQAQTLETVLDEDDTTEFGVKIIQSLPPDIIDRVHRYFTE